MSTRSETYQIYLVKIRSFRIVPYIHQMISKAYMSLERDNRIFGKETYEHNRCVCGKNICTAAVANDQTEDKMKYQDIPLKHRQHECQCA